MKALICLTTIVSTVLIACSVPPTTYAGIPPEIRKIGGRSFHMDMPKGMKLASSFPLGDANYAPYIQWGRRPWSPGFLMETRNANVLVISYLKANDLSRLGKINGGIYTSGYYADTILKHHAEIEIYKTQKGRAPALVRYDVKDDGGVFSLVASVDSYDNPNYDSDVLEFIAALKTFVPIKTKP